MFWLIAEICGVNLRIQSECGKIWARKDSLFGHFSRKGQVADLTKSSYFKFVQMWGSVMSLSEKTNKCSEQTVRLKCFSC